LIWRLILHYQISSSGSTSGKQLLLLWLRNALPDLTIKNVTTNWNDGIALSALVDFCQPGLIPNYKSLNPEDRLRNVTVAMKLAEDKLRIPQILSPEFFVSPYVDELSMMTYLSFFTQPGSPGERRTLEIVNEGAPKLQARNFNSDWNIGQSLGLFLESQCPGIIPDYDRFDSMTAVQRGTVYPSHYKIITLAIVLHFMITAYKIFMGTRYIDKM
jgi:filamin